MIPQDTPIATVLMVDDSAVNLMLLGMMMPDMDGYGVLARLHEDARTRDIPAQIELEQARDRLQEHNAFLEPEVAHRMRAEEEMRSLNADLERRAGGLEMSNRDLEAFSYTVSHDLRTPLRAINAYARILRESESERLSPEGNGLLGRVAFNAVRMNELMDDVLAPTAASTARRWNPGRWTWTRSRRKPWRISGRPALERNSGSTSCRRCGPTRP